jgi:formate hydrogenlyase subunit 6/NADH:ubiquinone oxidoreductase subunit I
MPVALGLEKVTEEFPEYLGLKNVVTDEMAEVAVIMDKRVPIAAAEVTKKCGKPLARTEELLEELALRGVIEYNWENEDHHKQYVLPMFVPGSAEYMNMNLDTVTAHPEVATMFERMSCLPLEKITPMVPPGGAGIGMHVVPVEKAIPSEQKSVDLEHLSHWLDKYDGKCAVGACSCRRSRRVRSEGCGHLEEDMCIAVGDMVTYAIETNKARPATREEVMEILQRAEDNGFVHQITNIDGKDKILGICNCCVCSCYALRTSQLFNTPNMSASAYRAHVDPEKCVACGQCAEVCPAGAAKLGQKLCTKDGPIVYPKQVLPDETKWGPEMWNENYRDDNPSANCYDTGTAPCKSNCRHTLPFRAISAWQPKAATWMRSSSSKKRTPSPPSAATSATAAANRPAPAAAWTAPLPSTRSRNSSQSRSCMPTSATCRRCSISATFRSQRRSPSSGRSVRHGMRLLSGRKGLPRDRVRP